MDGADGDDGAPGAQGPRGLNWRGMWFEKEIYAKDDAVSWDHSSWIALQDITDTTTPPNENEEWALLASKGDQGEQGIQGEEGPMGPQGPAGADGGDGADGADGAPGEKGDKGDLVSQEGSRPSTPWLTRHAQPTADSRGNWPSKLASITRSTCAAFRRCPLI